MSKSFNITHPSYTSASVGVCCCCCRRLLCTANGQDRVAHSAFPFPRGLVSHRPHAAALPTSARRSRLWLAWPGGAAPRSARWHRHAWRGPYRVRCECGEWMDSCGSSRVRRSRSLPGRATRAWAPAPVAAGSSSASSHVLPPRRRQAAEHVSAYSRVLFRCTKVEIFSLSPSHQSLDSCMKQ
jgi:hypothetical protein